MKRRGFLTSLLVLPFVGLFGGRSVTVNPTYQCRSFIVDDAGPRVIIGHDPRLIELVRAASKSARRANYVVAYVPCANCGVPLGAVVGAPNAVKAVLRPKSTETA